MRILLISDNKILGIGGGSLEEYKYYDGLKRYAESVNGELKVLSIDEPFDESLTPIIRKTKLMDVMSRALGHSTYMYFVWKKHKKDVYRYCPDVVILGRSRLGFIARDIKRFWKNTKIVCNMENVEYDYVDGYFYNKTSLLSEKYIALEKRCVKRDETMCVEYSDAINYLSQRDYKRTHELYDIDASKQEAVLPICIKASTTLTKNAGGKNIVFIGSLGYKSNSQALAQFLDQVWLPYFADKKTVGLIVGGRNPSEELERKIKSAPNCMLFGNFKNLQDIIPIHSMMIAPIQKGAGMKVKVAESLSMGLVVAASDEALVGYEEAMDSLAGKGIIQANTPLEYKAAIEHYLEMSDEQMKQIEIENKSVYEQFYNYSRSRQAISKMMTNLVE